MTPASLFLLHALLIIGLPFGLWQMGRVRTWVPLVVVQIAVGLALGPSGLGQVAPQLQAWLFPPSSLAALDGLVWLGVVWFAFSTGLHLDLTRLDGSGLVRCGLASVVVPVMAGCGAAALLLVMLPGTGGQMGVWPFVAGVGIAVGVTALPVLAAMVEQMGLAQTPLGQMALGLAAINDGVLWLLVAVLLALSGGGGMAGALASLAAAGLWALGLWVAVRPLMGLLLHDKTHAAHLGQAGVVVLSVGLLASAMVAELVGLHGVIGAFAFGWVVPKPVARQLVGRFQAFLMVVLLPFFFMVTGLKTDLAAASGAVTVFVVTLAVSFVAKMGCGLMVGRCQGWSWRLSGALGALIGCKGLMELVVLALLRDRGILGQEVFSGMVLMALAATALAGPLARWLLQPAGKA